MRALFMLAAGLVAGGAATSQELAPEVLLLSRVKRHIEEELKALPNISCLETVHREQKAVKQSGRRPGRRCCPNRPSFTW